jgi:NAD(P)-dependent dehydrogenase (short-subunit alcohol dehydrogenase family)
MLGLYSMNLDRPFDFNGKVAVVVGGSGVLCGALAQALGQQGAAVVVVGHAHMARADAVADQILARGGQAIAVQADVLDRQSLEVLAQHTIETFGQVDILVNGAGGAKKQATTSQELSFFELPEEAVRWVFDLNFMGTFLACQAFGRYMVEQDSGSILNITSVGADRPLTRSVAYSAAKAAVVNFTKWLAVHISQEYSPFIRVNAIMPGFFLTEQNRFLLLDGGSGELTERGQRIIAHTPMGRFGTPEDLFGPAFLLLSDVAAFVHGTTVTVDGGISVFGGV